MLQSIQSNMQCIQKWFKSLHAAFVDTVQFDFFPPRSFQTSSCEHHHRRDAHTLGRETSDFLICDGKAILTRADEAESLMAVSSDYLTTRNSCGFTHKPLEACLRAPCWHVDCPTRVRDVRRSCGTVHWSVCTIPTRWENVEQMYSASQASFSCRGLQTAARSRLMTFADLMNI